MHVHTQPGRSSGLYSTVVLLALHTYNSGLTSTVLYIMHERRNKANKYTHPTQNLYITHQHITCISHTNTSNAEPVYHTPTHPTQNLYITHQHITCISHTNTSNAEPVYHTPTHPTQNLYITHQHITCISHTNTSNAEPVYHTPTHPTQNLYITHQHITCISHSAALTCIRLSGDQLLLWPQITRGDVGVEIISLVQSTLEDLLKLHPKRVARWLALVVCDPQVNAPLLPRRDIQDVVGGDLCTS